MSYSAKDTRGFEFRYNKAGFPANAAVYEGTTGTEYTRGAMAYMDKGLVKQMTSSIEDTATTPIVGVIAETKTLSKTDKKVSIFDNPLNVYEVSFAGHGDDSVAKTSTSLNTITVDDINSASADGLAGALVYVYEGPAKGDIKTVLSNTTAAGMCTISGEFSALPTTASSAVVIAVDSSSASLAGINIGKQTQLHSASKIDITIPTFAEGYINVLQVHPERLSADVMISNVDTIHGLGRSGT